MRKKWASRNLKHNTSLIKRYIYVSYFKEFNEFKIDWDAVVGISLNYTNFNVTYIHTLNMNNKF